MKKDFISASARTHITMKFDYVSASDRTHFTFKQKLKYFFNRG